ncbi:MAG: YiiD C-terminal domain-containing protein [Marinobacter sp.]|uniref:YiiD C-terminal domain-containing protein n=1 Tax=Marinobacter sp. TaxID=50741 RepID=UPI00299F223E|nr:YiiD C-terminal domain-containing protein [Marinobacter sp.]MDX1755056.1 YiiD C-terminal domain-containing protein [Marinobacter sp.]
MTLVNRMMELAGQWAAESDNTVSITQPLAWLRRTSSYIAINRMIGLAIPFTRRNGFWLEALSPGYVRASIALRGNRNHFGSLYAGAFFLVAEIPGGVMTLFDLGPEYIPILKEMTLKYHQPARSDVTVEFSISASQLAALREEADRTGKAAFTLEGQLVDAAGEHVATSVAQYRIRKQGTAPVPTGSG